MAVNERRQESAALAVLRAVHREPGIERAAVARSAGLASGFVAETVARLRDLDLIAEQPAPPTGGRGRPSTTLYPHPRGPLVAAVAISHERWRLAVVELGGKRLLDVDEMHDRSVDAVLAAVRTALKAARRRFAKRLRVVAIAVPGTVSGERLVQAPNLGWQDLDIGGLLVGRTADRRVIVGNDASFAAVAEARRGAAVGARTSLHLFMDAGIGGAVIDAGRLVAGARGMAGEFGHMPFGDSAVTCRCGARGCWSTTIDGYAIARGLGHAMPVDEVTYTRQVMAAAAAALASGVPSDAEGSPEVAVVQDVARSIGRGAAGLVNAMDPDIVTLGGMGRELMSLADVQLQPAYLLGLMQQRTSAPPALVPGQFGSDAPLIGAAEEAVGQVLSDDGLARWARDHR